MYSESVVLRGAVSDDRHELEPVFVNTDRAYSDVRVACNTALCSR